MRRFAAVPGLPPEWDELTAGGPLFATGNWLEAMRGRIPGTTMTFVLREAGRAVLALYGTVLDRPATGEIFDLPYAVAGHLDELPLSDVSRAIRASWRVPPPESWYPGLVLMLPGYECHPLGPRARDIAALAELVDAIVGWARGHRLRAVAFLYTPPSTDLLQRALRSRGFSRIALSFSCELPLTGTGFQDYLKALPRKRRAEVRRELRVMEEAGVRIRAVPVRDVPEDIVTLKCAHSARYNNGRPVDRAKARHRLEGLCAVPTPLLFRAELDGTLIGYGLFVRHGATWCAVSTGRDYGRRDARHAYFATLFYEPVRLAYALGARRLVYGHASWDAKLARGCEAVEMPGWVLPLDPALAPVVADSARTSMLAL